jgi:hypothetical protein
LGWLQKGVIWGLRARAALQFTPKWPDFTIKRPSPNFLIHNFPLKLFDAAAIFIACQGLSKGPSGVIFYSFVPPFSAAWGPTIVAYCRTVPAYAQ